MICIFISQEPEHILNLPSSRVIFINHVSVITDRPNVVKEILESEDYTKQLIWAASPEWEADYIKEAMQATDVTRQSEGSCMRTWQHSFTEQEVVSHDAQKS